MKHHGRTASPWSPQTRGLRVLLLGVAGLFLLTTGCLVDQSRKAKTATATLDIAQSQVVLVGTIHKMHLADQDYPMQVLGALIEDWNPDLVLVALPPHAMASGAWEQGPIEMSYVTWVARHAHIPVEGIGWHSPQRCKAKAARMMAKMPAMIEQMRAAKASGKPMTMKAIMRSKMISMLPQDAVGPARSLMQLMPPSFETAHSLAFERLQRILFNAMARTKTRMMLSVLAKEAHMAHLAARAICRRHARRVLVVVGLRHRTALLDYLAGLGARPVNPTSILAARGLEARAFLNRPISQQVVAMWRKAVAHIDAKLARTRGPMRMMLAMKKHCFELAISQNGRCCVARKKLSLPLSILSSMSGSTAPASDQPLPRTATPAPTTTSRGENAAGSQDARPAKGTGHSRGVDKDGTKGSDSATQPGPASRPQPASMAQPGNPPNTSSEGNGARGSN